MENPFPLYQAYTPTMPTVIYKHKPIIGPAYKKQVLHPRPQRQ